MTKPSIRGRARRADSRCRPGLLLRGTRRGPGESRARKHLQRHSEPRSATVMREFALPSAVPGQGSPLERGERTAPNGRGKE